MLRAVILLLVLLVVLLLWLLPLLVKVGGVGTGRGCSRSSRMHALFNSFSFLRCRSRRHDHTTPWIVFVVLFGVVVVVIVVGVLVVVLAAGRRTLVPLRHPRVLGRSTLLAPPHHVVLGPRARGTMGCGRHGMVGRSTFGIAMPASIVVVAAFQRCNVRLQRSVRRRAACAGRDHGRGAAITLLP